MIKRLLQQTAAAAGLTTYGLGLLQAKAYRVLNQQTAKALKKHDITPIDWALLGLVYESRDGIRLNELAQLLGVEAPFVTERSQILQKLNLITVTTLPKDKRVKCMNLTVEARKLIPQIEREIIATLRPLVTGANIKDILAYKRILELIVNNKPEK